MPYIPHTEADRRDMLAAIGVARFEDLLESVPESLRQTRPLELAEPLSEAALTRHVGELAARNQPWPPQDCYLGGGSYVGHLPETVRSLAMRSEFITAYTPYQAEVSQGTLQTIFEFQTMVSELAGLELANASLYDGATALVEGVRMALSVKQDKEPARRRVLVAAQLNPRWLDVLRTYLHPLAGEVELELLGVGASRLSPESLVARLGADVAAVVVQSPNALGLIEDVAPLAAAAHEAGALLVQGFDPLAVALFECPGEVGADIAVAEGQSISQPLQFGGPYIGLFAARGDLVKYMPGRLIGETLDAVGARGYVLTFQTREQHIRREKATSNICTNQALVATFATIHLALLGPVGLREKAQSLYTRCAWLAERAAALPGVSLMGAGERFREFALHVPRRDAVLARMRAAGLAAGLPLPAELGAELLLVAVNELQEQADLQRWLDGLAAALREEGTHA
ncbi:MAG: aminomethyl-transferring glycine dehydrogenase subunit GcvPA [Candidatus Delongbacteria bacterium]